MISHLATANFAPNDMERYYVPRQIGGQYVVQKDTPVDDLPGNEDGRDAVEYATGLR